MLKKLLDFESVEINEASLKKNTVKLEKNAKKDIAIIGMSGKFGSADNLDEYWSCLKYGSDFIREFPKSRRVDTDPLVGSQDEYSYSKAGYLNEIDKFDYRLFRLSLNEANLMDPTQRVYLETVWEAIEEAGYGGEKLKGSRTGVFLGNSSDSGIDYKQYVELANTEMASKLSLPGNIKSIIASRISYLLDLKGPSMVVDTACSSALVAIHLATNALVNGECDMAIAGGIKLRLLPLQKRSDEVNVRSSKGKSKTFDDSADGIGIGEGTGAIILKPLQKAIDDGDHIYAVIKGSAVNQDGTSMGITAPNSEAQEDVLIRAWESAGINPETISYIEAHGTATKLGDPIEINGLERAFRKYTSKKQFCSIGAVKTNLGHLDSAAGIAGIIKAVLCLNNKQLPPLLHFNNPNKKIDFLESPIYVNDVLTEWSPKEYPRRCGISSFGLSGTNCHIVLEEYVEKPKDKWAASEELQVFTLSALSEGSLKKSIEKYKDYFENEVKAEIVDICYTTNTGRGHYTHRIAFIVKDIEELYKNLSIALNCKSLDELSNKEYIENGIYYGKHRIVADTKNKKEAGELTEAGKRELSSEADSILKNQASSLKEICKLYVSGADINFALLYKGKKLNKVSLPVYQFEKSRCWVEVVEEEKKSVVQDFLPVYHSLLHTCLAESPDRLTFSTKYRADRQWVLYEHKINGNCVAPGTTYLEIALQAYKYHFESTKVEFKDIIFISPLLVGADEERDVQTILKITGDECEFTVTSKILGTKNWLVHAEGKILPLLEEDIQHYDIDQIKSKCTQEVNFKADDTKKRTVDIGPRWGEYKRLFIGEDEFLAYCELPKEYIEDLKEFYLHPAMMDRAVNAVNALVGQSLHLPLSYKTMKVFGPTPKKFYSYLRKNSGSNGETISFTISLIDETGTAFAEIPSYTIKKVHAVDSNFPSPEKDIKEAYGFEWVERKAELSKHNIKGGILVLKDSGALCQEYISILNDKFGEVYEAELGSGFAKLGDKRFKVGTEEKDYKELLAELYNKDIGCIFHMFNASDFNTITDFEVLKEKKNRGVDSLYHLTRALVSQKYNKELELCLVAAYADMVTKDEDVILPHNNAFLGVGKVIEQEHPNIKVKAIDIDKYTSAEDLLKEFYSEDKAYQVAIRKGKPYIQELGRLDYSTYAVSDMEIKEKGVYVIIGGTGGIGLEMGKYLASRNKVKLCLINRSPLPVRESWDEILQSDEDKKSVSLIRGLLELEEQGAEVLCRNCDIADMNGIKDILEEVREKFGSINGIIHGAGVAGDGFIIKKDKKTFDEVISPKFYGTWILDTLTEKDDIDFFISFSSTTAVFGIPGQSDYTAANSYLDSFCALGRSKNKKYITINWPAWTETGMAVKYKVDGTKSIFKGISTKNAIAAFEKIVNRDIQRIIPAELNYDVAVQYKENLRIKLTSELEKVLENKALDKKKIKANEQKNKQVIILGKAKEEINETDIIIAQAWANVLGLEEVDAFENFYSLGGDSILATRLLKEIEKNFSGVIDISDIFTYATVDEMSRHINKKLNKDVPLEVIESSDEELDRILSQLANGEIAPEEVEGMLNLEGDEIWN